MGKRKNTLEDDIDDVFGGWAVSQKAKEDPELYEPGKDKDSPPTRAKDQKRGVKSDPQNRPSKTDPLKHLFKQEHSKPVQQATSIMRHLRLKTIFQRRTSFCISMRSMRSFCHHLSRQIVCPV